MHHPSPDDQLQQNKAPNMSFFDDIASTFKKFGEATLDEIHNLVHTQHKLSPLMLAYRDYVYQTLLRNDTYSYIMREDLPVRSSEIKTGDAVLCLTSLQRHHTFSKGLVASGHSHGGIQIWDIETQSKIRTFDNKKTTSHMKMENIRILEQMQGVAHTDLLVCACDNFNGFFVYNWHTGVLANIVRTGSPVLQGRRNLLAFGDKYVMAGLENGTLSIYDISFDGGRIIQCINSESTGSPFFCIEACLHGRVLCGGADASVQVWNLQTETREVIINLHKRSIRTITLINANRFATGSFDRTIRIFDIKFQRSVNVTCVAALCQHSDTVRQLAVFGKNWLLSVSDDGYVCTWDTTTFECVKKVKEHSKLVFSVATVSQSTFVSGSFSGDIRVWGGNTSFFFRNLWNCKQQEQFCDLVMI
jgi:WD40 repeat protein